MNFNEQIGANIRRVRSLWHITQGALAERVNRSRPSIANIEKGSQGISVELLADIAMALGVSPTELIQTNNEEKPMRKEPNPPAPEGVEKPDPPPVPPSPFSTFDVCEKDPMEESPPPIFNNPTAQRAYEALMDDARMREKDLKSSSLNPNDIHQFMLDAHAQAIRTAYDIVTEGVRAVDGTK